MELIFQLMEEEQKVCSTPQSHPNGGSLVCEKNLKRVI
jgi:hypothetical protein